MPIRCHKPLLNTCNYDEGATSEIPSKYGVDQNVWIKLDTNAKWVPGKIKQVLPNQSYEVTLTDGRIFRRNEHHITLKWQGAKWPDVPHVPQSLNYLNPTILDLGNIKSLINGEKFLEHVIRKRHAKPCSYHDYI